MTEDPRATPPPAEGELQIAENRLYNAELDTVRSSVVADMLDAAIRAVRELHVENGYAPKLRGIFRS